MILDAWCELHINLLIKTLEYNVYMDYFDQQFHFIMHIPFVCLFFFFFLRTVYLLLLVFASNQSICL